FGSDGTVTTPFGGSSDDRAYSVAIQSDGKIVAAGFTGMGGSIYEFALARYNPDGSLDTSFGTAGRVTTPIGSSHDEAHSVAIQADGKIVVAGFTFNGSNNDFALVRYDTNGSIDSL